MSFCTQERLLYSSAPSLARVLSRCNSAKRLKIDESQAEGVICRSLFYS